MSARSDPSVRGAARAEPALRAKLDRLSVCEARSIDDDASGQRRADDLLARIAWSRIAEPGDGIAGALIAAMGAQASLETLIRAPSAAKLAAVGAAAGLHLGHAAARAALGRWCPRIDRAKTLADIDGALEAGLRAIAPTDPLWPEALGDLGEHQPLLLWVHGHAALLNAPSLSVVGARAATGYGINVTAEIVAGVCGAGFAIVSGAAYGIDAVAHRTALAAGAPTVAVLAGGADRAYPASHEPLLRRIAADGAVCTEMNPGSAPTRWRFLQRNRVIAALSGATLVTEAGLRSGTLNTAGHAATLGRPLGAVPGPVTSAASAGCHRLIRDYGAALVTSAAEACELLGLGDGAEPGRAAGADDGSGALRESSSHRRVLDALPLRGGRSAPEVARRAGLDADETRGALAELELLGRVKRRDSPSGGEVLWALLRRQ